MGIPVVLLLALVVAVPAAPRTEEKDQNDYGFLETMDAGGWFSLTALTLDELDHNRKALDTLGGIYGGDLRIWLQGDTGPSHHFYVRARKLTLSLDTPKGVAVPNTANLEKLDLDLGYFEQPVGRFDMRLGRQFIRTGRGLALSQVLDGVQFTYPRAHEDLQLFVGRNTHGIPSLDTSIVGFDTGAERRTFIGAQYDRLLDQGSRGFAYLFEQHDSTQSNSPFQNSFDFGYHSEYFGFGIEGPIQRKGRYFVEAVREWGSEFIDVPAPARIPVVASAMDAGYYHYFKGHHKVTGSVEYMYGTGDPSRSSVTNTFGAHFTGAQSDGTFRGFGRIDGGLGLSPLLANINILRLGLEWKPFADQLEPPADLQLGTHVYDYRKDRALGAISDAGATVGALQVGTGLDLVLAWHATADVNYLAIWGVFLPGPAYPATADDMTRRALVSMTYSF